MNSLRTEYHVPVRSMKLTRYHQPEEFRKGQKERRDSSPYVLTISQNPPHCNPSWLSDVRATRRKPESDWMAGDNPETNYITIKPKTASHMAEQCSWVPWPCCSAPSFPIKSFILSARVSPETIHFKVLDRSPLSGPGRGSPFLQQNHHPIQDRRHRTSLLASVMMPIAPPQ